MKKIITYLLLFLLLAVIVAFITAQVVSAPATLLKLAPAVWPNASPQAPEIATTTIIFGGDVMLSRNVNQQSAKYGDWAWPLKKIASTTAAADLFVINLESPFTIGGNHLVKTGSFSFNADPRSLEALTLSGVDVVSLANNHTTNQGKKGISDTQKLLAENNIAYGGAGLNEAEARLPVIREINGVKFGFLAYAYPDDYSLAGASNFGLAGMDIDKMTTDVSRLKQQTDIIIIIMHAGYEYTTVPNRQQKNFAQTAIDAGADLVVGHHPHWAQTTEVYKGKPILYSLGNLVFDQMWSKETGEGALAKVLVTDKKITSVEIIPIIIKDYGQAEIADDQAKTSILKQMALPSGKILF